MHKPILFISILICFGLICVKQFLHRETPKPLPIEVAKISKLPALKPEEVDQRFDDLAAQAPQEKLKDLKTQFDRASENFHRRLRDYEISERQLGRKILASVNPAADRGIERLHEELRHKFSDLQSDNEKMTHAAANLNRRLLKLAQKMNSNGETR